MVKGVIVESIESDIPEDLVQIFKVLGDKTRLRIIKLLMQNVCTTQELAQKLEISEAAVSKHLQIMWKADLVHKNKKGFFTMNGVDAVKNHRWVKERINVISGGERNLYWRLTAIENLKYFGSLYGLSGVKLKEKIAELLKIVGLEEAEDIPVERYSKGMKQRLQIARGLINDPEYIFLDEPTLGLDIVIAKEIRTMIKELAQEGEKGVLLTTHYISEAEELCDYIYVLDKGRMIAQGTKEELKDLFASEPKMVLQEPGLEEILMKIIYRSRGEDSEENIFGNKSRN